jgi:hypothetical protein
MFKPHIEGCVSTKDLDVKTLIVVQLMEAAKNPSSKWVSGRAIVEPIVKETLRAKNGKVPKHPKDINFDFETLPPDFLVADLLLATENDRARHVIFATEYMLQLLSQARRFYVDGTFSVVREPFKQLFTIHVTVRSGDQEVNVPVCFVLMSRRRTKDYIEVFRGILNKLPSPPVVEEIVLDFEAATWNVRRETMRMFVPLVSSRVS